jgi:hypothetical protein
MVMVCRLVSGVLQLPKGTHLILDETAMTDGQLSAKGVQNLTSLGIGTCPFQIVKEKYRCKNLTGEIKISKIETVILFSKCRKRMKRCACY